MTFHPCPPVGLFRGIAGELALYTSSTPDAANILDYAAWGEQPNSSNSEAARLAALWLPGIKPIFPAVPQPGDMGILQPGGSIGRKVFTKPDLDDRDIVAGSPYFYWMVYIPEETSLGQENPWPSPLLLRATGASSLPGVPHDRTVFGWGSPYMDTREWSKHLQVAADPEFRTLVIDKVVPSGPYQHVPALPPGKYYWRVRLERGAETTPWAPAQEFTIKAY